MEEEDKAEPMVKATSHKEMPTYPLTQIMAKRKKKKKKTMKTKGEKQIFTFKKQQRLWVEQIKKLV